MKCAYKKVQQKQQLDEVSESILTIYKGISVVVLRELFHFGFKRYSKYCEEVVADADVSFMHYQEDGEDGRADGVISAYYAMRRAVKDIGVDLDEIERSLRYETYARQYGGKNTQERVADRVEYLRSSEKAMGVLWMLSMLWLHDVYGYGIARMSRYYRQCREEFMNGFVKPYLHLDNDNASKYVSDLVKKCEEYGVSI